MTLENDLVCLQAIPMFRNVPPGRLKLVAMMGERLRYAAGDLIIRERELPEAAFLILRGEVEISRDTEGEHLHALSIVTGGIFGDVPMLCDSVYLGQARAKTDVELVRLPRDMFLELLETVPEFAVALAKDLAARLYRLVGVVMHARPAS